MPKPATAGAPPPLALFVVVRSLVDGAVVYMEDRVRLHVRS